MTGPRGICRHRADGPRHGEEHPGRRLPARGCGPPQPGSDRGAGRPGRDRASQLSESGRGIRRGASVRDRDPRGRERRLWAERTAGGGARRSDRHRLLDQRTRFERANQGRPGRAGYVPRRCSARAHSGGRRGGASQHDGGSDSGGLRARPAPAGGVLREHLPHGTGGLRPQDQARLQLHHHGVRRADLRGALRLRCHGRSISSAFPTSCPRAERTAESSS